MRCQPLQPVRRECVRQCHRVCNTRHGVGGVPHRLRGCIRRGRKLSLQKQGFEVESKLGPLVCACDLEGGIALDESGEEGWILYLSSKVVLAQEPNKSVHDWVSLELGVVLKREELVE